MKRLRAAAAARSGRRYFLGLDFDGTLAPLRRSPELACLPARNRRALRRLRRLPSVRVAVISGRALADLKRRVGVPGLIYVGNHGLEIEEPDGASWVHPQASRQAKLMRRLAGRLAVELKGLPGILIEDKTLTLTVHYRLLPRSRSPRPIAARIRALLRGLEDRVALRSGKKVWEIRPALRWNKGHALRRLLGPSAIAEGWLPVFIGDDQTDEEGFASLGPHALTVRVGYKKGSRARFRLRSQGEVAPLLEHFARQWR
ncbi:MAG: trehalose-phosphatase [Elusimicrobia bacterium]|nr:trehalose-phosphatase [Elusimicrobiota bacterium]MDE2236639.1 trehalose-phosphatase [Elusimicrobiota bacterium]MDE2425260.1 trehalose-phosphatase [Elusimicrobiota bacterium]